MAQVTYRDDTVAARRKADHRSIRESMETMMATTATETAEQDLKLTPPEPVPVVAPEKAVGLVPVDDATKTKLEERVDAFVTDLVAQEDTKTARAAGR